MKSTFIKYLYSGTVKYLLNKDSELEKQLKELGYEMGKRMIILQGFKQNSNLEILLYKITFIFLPFFYDTDRKLERTEMGFVIIENNSLFTKDISVPSENFCCDSIFAGVIESVLRASGFISEVTGYNSEAHPSRVLYVIKLCS